MTLGRADHNACLFIMLAYLTTSSIFKLDSNLLYEIQFFILVCKFSQGYADSSLMLPLLCSEYCENMVIILVLPLFIRKGQSKWKETKSRLKGHQLLTHRKGHPRKDNNKSFNRLNKVIITYVWNQLKTMLTIYLESNSPRLRRIMQ